MIDALGSPQSLLVLGGTSDIAGATAARLARGGRLQRVVLAGRNDAALAVAAEPLRSLGVPDVSTTRFDARDTGSHEQLIREVFAAGDIDVALFAAGVLPDQPAALAAPDLAIAASEVNYLGTASVLLRSAAAMQRQGHGALVVLSTVAAERARRSNFVYGAAKAGIDALATGLGDELIGSGVSVLVVRPGFVRTAMTEGLQPAPLATTPDVVAASIADNLTRTGTVWVPGTLRPVMSVLRHLPRPVFRRLPI